LVTIDFHCMFKNTETFLKYLLLHSTELDWVELDPSKHREAHRSHYT